ncbi:hypothetical protein SO802_009249 [Lithocarpus litseifolius]|uniref:Uncharacterized protein n=1 Tax=Lithocarpus litseifolius TaxID=425828 RepID=A0AAW2DAW4_9ROSI
MGFMIRVHLQSPIPFRSSTQLFDEMLLQDIEPACLANLCYSSSQLLRELANRNLFTDTSWPSSATEEECLDYLFITYNLSCVMWFRSPLTIRRVSTNIWEVDTPVKPPNVLFNSFLGNIAHDQMPKQPNIETWHTVVIVAVAMARLRLEREQSMAMEERD